MEIEDGAGGKRMLPAVGIPALIGAGLLFVGAPWLVALFSAGGLFITILYETRGGAGVA